MEPPLAETLKVECANCGQHIAADLSYAGQTASCPNCNEPVSIPVPPIPSAATPPPLPKSSLDADLSDVADHTPHSADIAGAVRDTFQHFRGLDYNFLFPLRRFFSADFLRRRAVKWVLTFGLFPLVILFAVLLFGLRFDQSAWLIGGYFCYFWAVYFNGLIRPERPLWRRGVGYLCFTAFLGIPLLLAWQRLPIISSIYLGTESQNFIVRTFGFVAGVGIFEETCKALPLLCFSLRRGVIPIREGVFLGLMSGLGFALAEVVHYSINYWQETAHLSALVIAQAAGESRGWFGHLDADEFTSKLQNIIPQLGEHYGTILTVQMVRFIPLPLLHAAWAGTVGWFVAVATARDSARWPTIAVGIAFMAIIHGLYDVFSSRILGLAFAAFSILAFLCYLLHAEEHDPKPPQSEPPANG